jgi:ABC-2 type transport system permease protein
MPPLAVILVEKLAFGTGYFALLLRDRLAGGFAQALAIDPNPAVDYAMSSHFPRQFTRVMDPGNFLASPALWIGLAVAAAFIAAAVWMRRYREPL